MKIWFLVAGINGLLAVLLAAFGFHNLREAMTAHEFAVFSLGSQFHLGHAVALLGVAILVGQNIRLAHFAGIAFVIGTIVFSGALYTSRLLGPLTEMAPFGLLFIIAGWILIGLIGLRRSA
ncbi:MAG: DUF423 domain-containing protein [Gammaproteobacteria bacterium]